jgi:hypothetical protein
MQITQVSKNCIIDTSDNVRDGLNHVTEKISEEAITTTDPDIIGIFIGIGCQGWGEFRKNV